MTNAFKRDADRRFVPGQTGPVSYDDSYASLPQPLKLFYKQTGRQLGLNATETESHCLKSRLAIRAAAEQALVASSGDQQTSALLLGVGRATDVPLAYIIERFDKVTIADIDIHGLELALDGLMARHELSGRHRAKVDVVAADVSGVMGGAAQKLLHAQQKYAAYSDFNSAALDILLSTETEGKQPYLGSDYTFGCTQLLASQLGAGLQHFTSLQTGKIYGTEYIQDDSFVDPDLDEAFSTFSQRLQISHLGYLKNALGLDGTLHYADTDIYNGLGADGEDVSTLVGNQVKDYIQQNFKELQPEARWEYYSGWEVSCLVLAVREQVARGAHLV